jgi:hypothetical protein
MLGQIIRALVQAILEERELYRGNGIVIGNPYAAQIDRLVAELDKMTFASWEPLREALARDRLDQLPPVATALGELEQHYPELAEQARQVLGENAERWLDDPNLGFGGLTPFQMVLRGEAEQVREVLIRIVSGTFS